MWCSMCLLGIPKQIFRDIIAMSFIDDAMCTIYIDKIVEAIEAHTHTSYPIDELKRCLYIYTYIYPDTKGDEIRFIKTIFKTDTIAVKGTLLNNENDTNNENNENNENDVRR
eukprot:GHVR01176285.1.p2 GENE.GHVR01176285.1~~GHVR01176285.1.p2  ORF type:complete len:112 (+),score=21.44 GHVR01176285.1:1012-1347(+)